MKTLQEAMEKFLAAKAVSLKKKSVESYGYTFKSYTEATGGEWPATSDTINKFLAYSKNKEHSPATTHNLYRHIRAFFNWLHARGLIEVNPIELAERPRLPKPLPKVPPEADVRTVLNYLAALALAKKRAAAKRKWREVRNVALVSFMLDTGLRVSELCALTLEDISLERMTVTVRDSKNWTDDVSVFSPETAELLQNWLDVRVELDLPGKLENALWISAPKYQPMTRLTQWGVRQVLYHACDDVGVKKFSPHQLRHACAVYSLRAGADLLDVQSQLRHKDITVTARYTRVDNTGRQARHMKHSPLARMVNGGSS